MLINKRINAQTVCLDVVIERDKQDRKWGTEIHSRETMLTVLMEEVGEAAKAVLEGDFKNYEEELIQVAAVAVKMIEQERRRAANET